ncbi:hypothetical protein NLS1_06250 [Nocardioides sp. LS1]|nr:hypothetical protein NLS1_06250 [Nocardioides sp. LS1]
MPPGAEEAKAATWSAWPSWSKLDRGTLLVESVGSDQLVARSRWIRPGGRVAVIGYAGGTRAMLDLPNWLLDDVALLPVNMLHRDEQGLVAMANLERLLPDGELRVPV